MPRGNRDRRSSGTGDMVEKIRNILNSKRDSVFLLLILCLGAALRILYINGEDLWCDEALTALSLRLPFFDMVSERLSVGHSPLYFSILYPVFRVFGTGEVAVRLLSAIASVLSLYVFWRLAEGLFSDLETVSVSTLFFALSAMNIYFGQEARMYAFCVLAVLCSFIFLIRALNGNRTGCWICYVIATASAIYFSSSVIPVVFAQLGLHADTAAAGAAVPSVACSDRCTLPPNGALLPPDGADALHRVARSGDG
jgi:4-amino-4-deoxy-L-arabinose transferase-like glycosyltransferase